MSFIRITKDNIETEHICCALGAKQYEVAVLEKKKWLTDRMNEGLVFYRLDERAKVFIEYIPAENAWAPIFAPNFMFINCLWVSGRHKSNGYAKKLLEYCKEDAIKRGMDGIVHIVGNKKYPYLSDGLFFEHMGFQMVDEAAPYFQLVCLKWNEEAENPCFKKVKQPTIEEGVTIYYTAQCPFAVGVIRDLEKVAKGHNVPFRVYKTTTREEAQKSINVWPTFGLFYNGNYITHEILSQNKFEKLLLKLKEKG